MLVQALLIARRSVVFYFFSVKEFDQSSVVQEFCFGVPKVVVFIASTVDTVDFT